MTLNTAYHIWTLFAINTVKVSPHGNSDTNTNASAMNGIHLES